MIPQQSGKIKFCVMKFANIFLAIIYDNTPNIG